MNENPFALPGRFFRGNLHTHSTNSDGDLTPEEVVRLYRDRGGHDFLALTDHGKVTDVSGLAGDGFVLLPGAELHYGKTEQGHGHHVLALDIAEAPKLPPEASVQECVDAVRELGGECFLCHPYWHGCTSADLLHVEGVLGIEVYNYSCEIAIARGDCSLTWDELLARGRRWPAIAVDDAHFHRADFLGGWVNVKAPELSREAILHALRQGHYYSSAGPEIHDLRIEDGRVTVECSPARRVQFVSAATHGACFADVAGEPLTRVEWDMRRANSYFRVVVEDEWGRRAWSNPFFLD